jgi:hypothetical protein
VRDERLFQCLSEAIQTMELASRGTRSLSSPLKNGENNVSAVNTPHQESVTISTPFIIPQDFAASALDGWNGQNVAIVLNAYVKLGVKDAKLFAYISAVAQVLFFTEFYACVLLNFTCYAHVLVIT